jgi:aminobenzoyl-glutamate utilization protein B
MILLKSISKKIFLLLAVFLFFVLFEQPVSAQQKWNDSKIDKLKKEVAQRVQEQQKMAQVMVDKVFSFAELGFQEYETSRYLTDILKANGFEIQHGISGVPTAWIAKWGKGKPVIALGSDIDCIPKASQKPGVAYHDPIIEDAPGHGEGHNSGVPLNILAALEVKKIMEREGITGTLMLWPGVAEELLATKAYYVRDGYFDDVDICLFPHVSSNFSVDYGQPNGTGMISVEYSFEGESAHSAGAPWRGRSALDAVELTSIAWQYQREHLDPLQRSHHVINNGGDQPNVVPQKANIWFFIRDVTYPKIMYNYERLNQITEAAAIMTQTKGTKKILGSAWPRHFNKVIAETMYENIKVVGLPEWTADDQKLAKALQEEIGLQKTDGLASVIPPLRPPSAEHRSGGSDDIGDVSWKVPTVTFRYPANIPGLPGHNWADAVAMATPIAHKGVVAGARVEAMTIIDFLLKPHLVKQAWDYFNNVQLSEQQYKPMVTPQDKPVTYLNLDKMSRYRKEMEAYYYDETKYESYLEQLGISYPTLPKPKQK